jgi:DNA-binding transcriptional regulator YhcF (GntR family)
MPDSEIDVLQLLRRRISRAVQAGVLQPGSRLPSARVLQAELDVDHRVVLAAYRELADEGLIEMRTRGGVYLANRPSSEGGVPPLPEQWIVEVLGHGVARDIPIVELHEWLRRCVETLRLRAVAFESSDDQREGLCRELVDDYGLEASSVDVALIGGGEFPPTVRRADLFVTTARHDREVRKLAADLGKHCVTATVRPDLISGEWRLLLTAPVYVLIADAGFIPVIKRFFANTPGAENLRPLVAGEDDLSQIPPDAPTYITRRARDLLGDTRVPGRIVPAPRLLSNEAATEIIGFIVRSNLRAMRGKD